ncbi:putative transcriptional regulatory protein, partial [Lachnellula suecica]
MAIDQVQQRKRRRGTKVKTGCGTCKFRRIKCDEAKPICQRCASTGRKCDGYSSDITLSSTTPKYYTDLIQRVSVHIPGNAEEKRGFDFFIGNTAAELSGYYDTSFWEKLILAASAQTPSLRHAVIGLGALHEGFLRKGLAPSSSSNGDPKAQLALNQYAKAMGELRRSLAKGKEEPLTALMSCILFVCFDCMRGWFESAMIHLESGLKILQDIRSSSSKNRIIEDNIAPLLMRLSIQSIIYVGTRSPDDQKAFARQLTDVFGKAIVVPEEFESLEEARKALEQLVDGLFRTNYTMGGHISVPLGPLDRFAIFDEYATQLSLWNHAFEKFMKTKSNNLSSREVQGAALLKIHHTTVKIMTGLSLGREGVNEKLLLKFSDDFQIVVNLSKPLIAAIEQDTKKGKPSLTFVCDLGLIAPLYYVCVNCPVVSIRKAAMELLLWCPRREGMWNSVLIAQMIQQFWELEAKHKEAQEMSGEVDEFGLPVPFSDGGFVHLAFFGRPTEISEMNTTGVSEIPLPGSASLG